MKIQLAILTVFALAVVATSAVQAAEGDKPSREERRAKFIEKFDENKNGKLDDAERAKAKEAFGKNRPEGGRGGAGREAMLKKFDANGDGKLDDAERAKAKEEWGKRREEMLKKFDANGDGKLDDAEKAKLREEFPRRGKGEKGKE